MLSGLLATLLLSRRPTIGRTTVIAATAVAGAFEFAESGLYLIQNMGPNLVYLRMHKLDTGAGGWTITAALGMPLTPYVAGVTSAQQIIPVEIGMLDVKSMSGGMGDGFPEDAKYLHHICPALGTAEVRVTLVTKR